MHIFLVPIGLLAEIALDTNDVRGAACLASCSLWASRRAASERLAALLQSLGIPWPARGRPSSKPSYARRLRYGACKLVPWHLLRLFNNVIELSLGRQFPVSIGNRIIKR